MEGRLPRYQEEKKRLCNPAQVSVDSSGIKLGYDGNFPALRERAQGPSFRKSSREARSSQQHRWNPEASGPGRGRMDGFRRAAHGMTELKVEP